MGKKENHKRGMIVYWFIICLIFFIYIMFKRYHKENSVAFCVIIFFILTIISGCRASTVGTDTHAYLNLFLINNDLLSGFANQEILFEFLCKFIGLFTTNAQWLLIVCSAITNFGVLYFAYFNSKNVTLSIFLYISLYFYFFSMNGVRQFVAIGIVLIASEFAKRRKIIPFIVLILLAIGFHSTAIFALILWFVFDKKLSKKMIFFIAILLVGGVVVFDRLIPVIVRLFPRYEIYLENSSGFQSGGVMAAVVYTIIFGVGIAAALDKNWYNTGNKAILLIVGIASIFSIASFSIGILRRVCWMFEIYSIVLIPNLLYSKFYYRSRYYLYIFIVLMGSVYLVYCFSFNWNAVLPYKFA